MWQNRFSSSPPLIDAVVLLISENILKHLLFSGDILCGRIDYPHPPLIDAIVLLISEIILKHLLFSGDILYGRIDSPSHLGNEVSLGIDKVFLCSGKDGYIPMYDPVNKLNGCVGPNDRLEHSFKILVSHQYSI